MRFADYSDAELLEIFERLARSRRFEVSSDILAVVAKRVTEVRGERGTEFGNAREIHTLWDQALQRQGMRLADALDRGENIESRLTELLSEDLGSSE